MLREMFYQNFIPYIALQVSDHHELHAIAVRLGMNEYQFAAVLGAVSNNLLTKRYLLLVDFTKSLYIIKSGDFGELEKYA